MTYRCGIGPGIPGLEPGEPQIRCDNCDAVYIITFRFGPPKWLRDRRAPPGWAIAWLDDVRSLHACPSCVAWLRGPIRNDRSA